jgi:hypothetical protein
MKKKILGMFVCILLITTAFPTVGSLKNSVTNAPVPSTSLMSRTADWMEMQKLLPSDAAAGDAFSCSVSFSWDIALIGAPFDDDNGNYSGSAYIFTRTTSTNWTQQAKLIASDGTAEDFFGHSVSLSWDTALIGAAGVDKNGFDSGSVYVFTRHGTTWTQQAKLIASDSTAGDHFGWSVSLSDDTALIGAVNDDSNGNYSGSAYIFTRTGTTWTQQAKLIASDGTAGDHFGYVVALAGDTALIGAPFDDDNGGASGSVYVFTRTSTIWTQQAKLIASDSGAGDHFGWSVSLSDDTALIGAVGDDDNGVDSGSAYVFTRNGTTWIQQVKLHASDGAELDQFGCSVALAGDTTLIGAPFDDDNGNFSGSVYMFVQTGTSWIQQAKLLALDGAAEDRFGWRVSLWRDTALIGAVNDDDNGNDSGSAYIFTKESGNQPPVFGTPIPVNGSTNNPLSLTWNISIHDPEGDVFSWTIQCSNGQTNSGTSASNGTKSLVLSGLLYSTTYKVWVNATYPADSSVYTRQWYTFTTTAYRPPNPPSITGPTEGKIDTIYDYNFTAIDPAGDKLYYFIDWGDTTNSSWIGPYSSGDQITNLHAWFNDGTYTVKAKIKDIYGNESDWATLSVTMPCSYNIPLFQFWGRLLERFPHAFPILRHLMGY